VTAHVRTPVFEGPIDVLFQLVSEHKLDVYDIPLAEIVDRFLAEIVARQPLDLETCSEFLLVAALLVELKSRTLLPGPDMAEDDEELAGFEERDRLLARLYELQAYAAAADVFASLIEQAVHSVPRLAGLEERFRDAAPELLAGLTAEQLATAYLLLLTQPSVPTLDLSHVTVEAVTVSEAVAELEDRLPADSPVSFRHLTRHCTTRMQVIVRFLALLELFKRGRVDLDQGTTFGDLQVTWVDKPAPEGGGERDEEPVEEYEG
jgi:segregation and condensation protein A